MGSMCGARIVRGCDVVCVAKLACGARSYAVCGADMEHGVSQLENRHKLEHKNKEISRLQDRHTACALRCAVLTSQALCALLQQAVDIDVWR
eukprot:3752677-Rhodomonas_salina.4